MDKETLLKELKFKAVRSSGAGGQHVNKVSSKVELFFDLENSKALSEEEKELLHINLKNRLTKENSIILFSDETRSQHKNKELVIKRFIELLKQGLKKTKIRKATKPSKLIKQKRLDAKKRVSDKKENRKKPKF